MVLVTVGGNSGNTTNQAVTYTVAANTTNEQFKAAADYVCDGTADDVQIQQALDDLTSAGLGGVIQLSEGTFNLAAGLTLDSSNIKLCGMGEGTLLSGDASSVSPFIAMADATDRFRIELADFRMFSTVADNGTAINAANFQSCLIRNVTITDFLIGIDMNDGTTFYNKIDKVFITVGGASSFGIRFAGGANANTAINATIRGDAGTVGILVDAQGIGLYSADVENTMLRGIQMGSAADATSIVNPWVEGVTTGIQIDASGENCCIFGGEVLGNTTNLTDNGVNTQIIGTRINSGNAFTKIDTNKLNLLERSVEIASGSVAFDGSYLRINTEGSAATDDLNNITGAQVGDICICRPEASTRDITFVDGQAGDGGFQLAGAANFVTATLNDTIMFIARGAAGSIVWCEISRSTN